MKSSGITRSVDELGRIVLPKSMRQHLEINERDQLEIFVEGNRIVLQKYEPACIFCGKTDGVVIFNGKRVCSACIASLRHMG